MARFDLSASGLLKLVKLGRFPAPFYVGARPLWREADLQAVESGTFVPAPKPKPDPPAPFDPLADDEMPEPAKRPRGRPPGRPARVTAYPFGPAVEAVR